MVSVFIVVAQILFLANRQAPPDDSQKLYHIHVHNFLILDKPKTAYG